VRDVLVEALYASGSFLVLLPVQDVFGWSDRINVPGTLDGINWTFRLPWPVDALAAASPARDRQQALRAWAERYERA
jgi:4-alpha-glucanotransferase